tara:strand:- start:184 stop:396 length:213 start_codon:yes stop_codon:yes gene_type:complete
MKLDTVARKAQALSQTVEQWQYSLENQVINRPEEWKDTPEADVWRELIGLAELATIYLGEARRLADLHKT